MKTFKQFIAEAYTYHPIHKLLNKAQLKAVNKHEDFKRYIHSYVPGHQTILARTGEHHDNVIHHYVMANTGQTHRMEVNISPRGKIYHSTIHRLDTDENGHRIWNHVKTTHAKQ